MQDTSFVSGGYISQMPLTRNRADIYSRGINRGLDIAVPKGTPVELPRGKWQITHVFNKATAEGPGNRQRGINEGYGNRVVALNLETGEKISFAHLSKATVRLGDLLNGGTVGYSGATGNVAGKTGAHVDIEYYDQNGELKDITKTTYWGNKANTPIQQQEKQNPFTLVKQAQAAENNFNSTIVKTPPTTPQVSASTRMPSAVSSLPGVAAKQIQPLYSYTPSQNIQLIRQGDTLSGIAKAYNTTWQNIAKLNPQIKNPNKIYAGDVLYVPTPRVVPMTNKKTSGSRGGTGGRMS